jgi:hypothetical protein
MEVEVVVLDMQSILLPSPRPCILFAILAYWLSLDADLLYPLSTDFHLFFEFLHSASSTEERRRRERA